MVDIHEHINATRQIEKIAMIRATCSRKIEDLIHTYPKMPIAKFILEMLSNKPHGNQ